MAVFTCRHPDTQASISVDDTAPGEFAGQTLTCRTGTDPKGNAIWSPITFTAPEPDPDPPEPDPADPWAQRVAEFLGQGDNPELVALAAQHVPIITAMARAYTRGNGFVVDEPAEDLAAVITTATARLLANPEQISTQVGDVALRGGFNGWSLAETFVLNRYRGTAR